MGTITPHIKGISYIMRKNTGVDRDAQRISQVVWKLFMKIFEDKEEEWEITIEDYKSPIPEPCELLKVETILLLKIHSPDFHLVNPPSQHYPTLPSIYYF